MNGRFLLLGDDGGNLWRENVFLTAFLSSSVNPCCYLPCQHWGVCVRFGLDKYECDCTRTGYHGENCTVRESRWLIPRRSALISSCLPAFIRNLKYPVVVLDSFRLRCVCAVWTRSSGAPETPTGSDLSASDLFSEPSAEFASLIHTNKELLLWSLI